MNKDIEELKRLIFDLMNGSLDLEMKMKILKLFSITLTPSQNVYV